MKLVASLYLIEIFTWAVHLASAGAAWNPTIYPALTGLAEAHWLAAS